MQSGEILETCLNGKNRINFVIGDAQKWVIFSQKEIDENRPYSWISTFHLKFHFPQKSA